MFLLLPINTDQPTLYYRIIIIVEYWQSDKPSIIIIIITGSVAEYMRACALNNCIMRIHFLPWAGPIWYEKKRTIVIE